MSLPLFISVVYDDLLKTVFLSTIQMNRLECLVSAPLTLANVMESASGI